MRTKLAFCQILLSLLWIPVSFAEIQKPNILVITLCSTGKKFITEKNTPNIYKFLNESIELQNAYAPLPWSDIGSNISRSQKIFEKDYKFYSNRISLLYLIDNTVFHNPNMDPIDEGYKELLPKLNQEVKPFISVIHIRMNHRPFLKQYFEDEGKIFKEINWSQDKIDYVKNKKKISQILDFMLFGYKQKDDELYPLIYERQNLLNWKNSTNYQFELNLLKEAYLFRLKKTDALIKKFLTLDEYPKLKQNTIIVLAGDHGEAFMEHDNLHAGREVFDEEISLFLGFKTPNLKKPQKIEQQFSTLNFDKFLLKLSDISFDSEKSLNDLPFAQTIFSRNCKGDKLSARQSNQWKLIKDGSLNEFSLFNLKSDPGETTNVFNENLSKAKELIFELNQYKFEQDIHFIYRDYCRMF